MINENSLKSKFADRAKQLKAYIIEQNIGISDLIRGCSKSEIIKLEQKYQILLPESYKVFLENFGHGLGGRIMNDCDILYNDIFDLTNTARNEILVEDGDPTLPEKAFVFMGRYKEQFWFFDVDGTTKEPSIYDFHVDDAKFNKTPYSVFDYLESEAKFLQGREQRKKKRNK